jgi:hypothetical protein
MLPDHDRHEKHAAADARGHYLRAVVPRYVRYQRPTPNVRGHHTGIFALVNGLAHAGALSPSEWAFWRTHNDWYEENLAYPDPHAYDRAMHPLATSWFRASAALFLAPVPGYLAILEEHDIDCVEVRADRPGIVVYEDAAQIVVVPDRVRTRE